MLYNNEGRPQHSWYHEHSNINILYAKVITHSVKETIVFLTPPTLHQNRRFYQ